MNITLQTYQGSRSAIGKKTIEWAVDGGATVEDVLSDLAEEYEIDDDPVVMKNGTNIKQLDGTSTTVEDGDILTLS